MTVSKRAIAILLAIMTALVMTPYSVTAEYVEDIPVTGIMLEQPSVTIEKGSSQSLVAIVSPEDATNKNVIWSSNNESVATVDGGVVSGISAGSTEITATTEEGEFTATCTVNVEIGKSETSENDSTQSIEDSTNIKRSSNLEATLGTEETESDISSFQVDAIADQTFTGKAITPKVVVKSGQNVLTEGVDYEVAFYNNIKRGTAKAVISGKGEYVGEKEVSFSIKPASLKSADLTTTSYVFNNTVKTPGVSVIGSVNSKKLMKGTDYTVSYANGRKDVGKYSVTIKGTGNYQGNIIKYFTIKPSKAVMTSAKVISKKMTVTAKAKASSYGGSGFQFAYKPSGGSWKYITASSNSKTLNVTASKRYSVKTRAYKTVGGTTYYGDWSNSVSSIRKIKVTFNANKGKVKTKSKKVWTDGEYGKLPKPKRSRYKFRGWYTKKSGGKKVTANSDVKGYKNHKLYAHWFGPKGSGGKISKAEYNRIKYGMSYSDVCYLIGGEGDRINSYTDEEYVEDSHEEWVDTGYWDYDYDYYGNETQYWVDDGYYETIDDSYWVDYYHETYEFQGQRSGIVQLEFVDGSLEEIYTYGFK